MMARFRRLGGRSMRGSKPGRSQLIVASAHGTVGGGPLHQGRFKSFPAQQDAQFLRVCQYVERNACTGGAVSRAKDWRFGSLWGRRHEPEELMALLSDRPAKRDG